MNPKHKYGIGTMRDDSGISHQCTMSYQKMNPDELKNLDELHKLYKIILSMHEEILKKNKNINSLETKMGVDFTK